MEERTFDPNQPFPFGAEWHRRREHAPHLEQSIHQPRMFAVAGWAASTAEDFGLDSIVDLGAGDGGMLTLLAMLTDVPCHGYDFTPRNVEYARLVRLAPVRFGDFVTDDIEWGQLAILAEVLEHLEDPHAMLRRVAEHCDFVIASSPSRETLEDHSDEHAWVFDMEGYRALFEDEGWKVYNHEEVEGEYTFQVLFAMSR